jgi:predicted glycoside hydrolase/deacetylase ChbG (UPF0249 family)
MSELAERLGYRPTDRLVIISANLLGSSHAANVGVFDTLRQGLATSASLLVPCPWARQAAADYRGEDVGIELTVNAPDEVLRWGPITQAPSLLDGDGGFPRTVVDLWDHADLDELRRECRAQLERAILWGFAVTHLATHLDALLLRPEFFDVYLDLAVEYSLPVRLGAPGLDESAGFPARQLAADEGVLFPERSIGVRGGRGGLERALAALEPGVTELYLRPAIDTPELHAVDPEWSTRVDDLHALTTDSNVRALMERGAIIPIGWSALRDVERTAPRP